ncbi:MAG: glycosyltransferase family 4 protein [Flavobacteriales bacterium]|nr:glycosyltransferase family 4 protein [Flavobacteriales bacterium]
MRILFITQYFPPEVGAPQSRLYELAIRLVEKGVDVTVLTAMPNYPEMKVHDGYRGKFRVKESIDGIEVVRSWIYVSRNTGFASRILNYLSFTCSSFITGVFSTRSFDYVFCESPPLFLGLSAIMLAKIKGSKLIFNVSDLWPETAIKLGIVKNPALIKLATRIEEMCYKSSWLITGQTKHITDHIGARFPNKRTYWLKNGSNPKLFEHRMSSTWRADNGYSADDFILVYAGIIGIAQGLEIILEAAGAFKSKERIKFAIIGSGPEKEKLVALRDKMGLVNVRFLDVQPKSAMPSILSAASAVIIPLKRLPLFKGAIPSKIYECAMMGKPLLLGVEGEAKSLFIDDGKCGLAFEPENGEDLADKIVQLSDDQNLMLQLGENGRTYVVNNFSLDHIAHDFWTVINQGKK